MVIRDDHKWEEHILALGNQINYLIKHKQTNSRTGASVLSISLDTLFPLFVERTNKAAYLILNMIGFYASFIHEFCHCTYEQNYWTPTMCLHGAC